MGSLLLPTQQHASQCVLTTPALASSHLPCKWAVDALQLEQKELDECWLQTL